MMLALTLIRLLRDTFLLVTTLGTVFTGFLVRSEYLSYAHSRSGDWQLETETQFLLISFAGMTVASGIAWFFVQRKERTMASRRFQPSN
jgi:hypothetical protein